MLKNKKIICVSPVGRKRYMEILFPYILKNKHIIDEYHLWFNTKNSEDASYIRSFAEANKNFVKIIENDSQYLGKVDNVKFFYKYCTDPDTIYIKIDDDIVFIEDGTFEKLVNFKINNPHYFLVYPMIINNHWCSYFLKEKGIIDNHSSTLNDWKNNFDKVRAQMSIKTSEPRLHHFLKPEQILCNHFWGNGEVAYNILNNFIKDVKENNIGKYKIGNIELVNKESCSINFICWEGETFKEFNGNVESLEDESWLTTFYPLYSNQTNCICSDSIVVHYSFYIQREYLDKSDILQKYKELCLTY